MPPARRTLRGRSAEQKRALRRTHRGLRARARQQRRQRRRDLPGRSARTGRAAACWSDRQAAAGLAAEAQTRATSVVARGADRLRANGVFVRGRASAAMVPPPCPPAAAAFVVAMPVIVAVAVAMPRQGRRRGAGNFAARRPAGTQWSCTNTQAGCGRRSARSGGASRAVGRATMRRWLLQPPPPAPAG